MKRLQLIIGLISASICPMMLHTIQPVALDSAILKLVDGTAMICIENIFSYAQNLITLSSGAKSLEVAKKLASVYEFYLPFPLTEETSGPNRFGLVPYQNGYKTAKDLMRIEQELGGMDDDLATSFEYLKEAFEKISIEYLVELQNNKAFMMPLIKNWSVLRNKPNSPLLIWSQINNNEKEALSKLLTNFSISDTLVEDLLLFLSDLIQNCPKSHKAYREGLKK